MFNFNAPVLAAIFIRFRRTANGEAVDVPVLSAESDEYRRENWRVQVGHALHNSSGDSDSSDEAADTSSQSSKHQLAGSMASHAMTRT